MAQTSRYRRLSDRNQFDVRVVPPVRGRLFDRKMRLVAGNAEPFELRITPLYADNLQETLKLLATIVDLPELRQAYVLDMAKTLPSFREIMVRDDLSQRELARLAVRSGNTDNGLQSTSGHRQLLRHALGGLEEVERHAYLHVAPTRRTTCIPTCAWSSP